MTITLNQCYEGHRGYYYTLNAPKIFNGDIDTEKFICSLEYEIDEDVAIVSNNGVNYLDFADEKSLLGDESVVTENGRVIAIGDNFHYFKKA